MTGPVSQICLIIGIILFLLGSSILIFEPYERIFRKIMIFYPGGIVNGFWYSSEVYLTMKVYVFNITNKEAFLAGKEKLKFQEVGPYIYREEAIHHNITFNHDEGTVSSSPRYTLQWAPDLNTGQENDTLILPHLAMLVIKIIIACEDQAGITSKFSYLNIPLTAFILQTKSSPIVQQTVREFLFGYDNAFIEVGHKLFPYWLKFDKVGVLDRVYDHEGDVATTYTGELDRHKTGLFAAYNNRRYVPHWDAPCNNIEGSSDGKKFGNDIKADEKLAFYRKGVCRALPLKTVSDEITDTFGLPTLLYKFEDNIFDNGRFDKNNKCFCKTNPCLPDTIQDISDCFYGFPVGLSFPHFMNGNNSLRETFEGLNPDPKKHDSYVYINPDAGYITKGSVKLQVNAILGDLTGISEVKQFSNMILPLAWADFALDRIQPAVNILLCLIVRIFPVLETFLAFMFIVMGISMTIYHTRKIMQLKYNFSSSQCISELEIEKQDVKCDN